MKRSHPESIPVHRSRPGVVWPSRIDPTAETGPTRKQARGPRWDRVGYGLYLPADLDPALGVEQRIVTAACEAGAGAAITGWAALRWRGAGWLDRPEIHVVDRHRARAEDVSGVWVTSALEAATQAVCAPGGLAAAVNILDRSSAADLFSLAEFERHLDEVGAGRRGVRQARRALGLAAENSWSPTETSMRLLWRRAGLSRVVCNHPVFDQDGSHLGTPDLLDIEHGMVGEYDGGHHLAGAQRAKDIRREAAFRRVGLEYVEMVAADLRDPTDFLARTRDGRARAARAGGHVRRWTIDPPPWWWPTVTVAHRRALPVGLRGRFLGWQRLGLPRDASDGPFRGAKRAI